MDVLNHSEGVAAADASYDMDIDMDIDLAPDPDISALEAEAEHNNNGMANTTAEASMEGDSVLEKVHIRGLDSLATADVKAFVEENYATNQFDRVEWVDDTSANIVYASAQAAFEALAAFTLPQDVDPGLIPTLQLRPAKRLLTHPETELYVRLALSTDVKKYRAHEASRFYLLNPDKDPREMKRQKAGRKGDSRYALDRSDSQRRKRRQDDRSVPFDESMYDDDMGSSHNNARGVSPSAYSDGEDRRRKRVRFDGRKTEDLFANKFRSDGRLRDRSASPGRDGDGRLGFPEDDSMIRSRLRRRSVTPPRSRPDDLLSHRQPVELFPEKSGGLVRPNRPSELFPNKTPPAKPTKELFPHKTPISNHRRTDAFDAADETSPRSFPGGKDHKSRDLFERINRPTSSFGRLSGAAGNDNEFETATASKDDISILGKGREDVMGFSIRGAAQGTEAKTNAKELFPNKMTNDLFAEKLQGRGGPRRRAQDLFS